MVGLPLAAVIAIDATHEKLDSLVQKLSSRPEVKWASTITGRFDIMILGRFRSTDDLSDFMRKMLSHMEGVRDSETFICLHVKKGRYVPIAFD